MDFETFILKQMKRAGVNKKNSVDIFRAYKDLFVKAFTHKSANPIDNYDMLEAFGDKIINTCLFDALQEKYPTLDQGTVTLAFQKAKSEEIFSREGVKEEFFDHIIMSPEYKHDCLIWRDLNNNPQKYTIIQDSDINNNLSIDSKTRMKQIFLNPSNDKEDIYRKVLEDTVESFCGALCKSINLWTDSRMGPGAEMVYRWALPIIEDLPFDCTNVDETRNIKQQMKEFWDTVYAQDVTEGRKMTNFMMYWHDKNNSRPGQVIMHATDPNPKQKGKRRILGSVIGPNQKYAQLYVAQLVFPMIKQYYASQYEKGLAYKQSLVK